MENCSTASPFHEVWLIAVVTNNQHRPRRRHSPLRQQQWLRRRRRRSGGYFLFLRTVTTHERVCACVRARLLAKCFLRQPKACQWSQKARWAPTARAAAAAAAGFRAASLLWLWFCSCSSLASCLADCTGAWRSELCVDSRVGFVTIYVTPQSVQV